MKTKSIFLLTFLLASCLASAQSYIPLQQHMQGVSGAEKITNLAEVEADLGKFTNLSATTGILSTANAQTLNVTAGTTTLTNTGIGNSLIVNDQTSDTTQFVIDATGNVGIGTASPGSKLTILETLSSGTDNYNTVSTSLNLTSDPTANTNNSVYYGYVITGNDNDDTNAVFSAEFYDAGASDSGNTLFKGAFTGVGTPNYGVYIEGEDRNYFSGNVGIGTTVPTKKLHVEGDIYALGDVSAATFTDRTPAPPEDSLAQILKVSSKNGEIDHDTLGAAKVKRVQKISYVNVYSATDNSLIVKIPTTLNENIINITEEVPEQIISKKESIELVKESAAQEGIQLKPDVVQENGVYKIPAHTKIIGQRNLIKEKIEQEYNIPQEEIILQEEEVIEEFGNRDIGMSVSMSIRSIQQLHKMIEELQKRLEALEASK